MGSEERGFLERRDWDVLGVIERTIWGSRSRGAPGRSGRDEELEKRQ